MHLPHHRGRAGFTLIEMLVVIAIIAVLVSLLAVGIFAIYGRASDTGAMVEINQIDEAVKAFKAKYGIPPPDHIRLYSFQSDYVSDGSPLARFSLTVINKMWPNIGAFGSTPAGGANPPLCWADGYSPFKVSGSVYSKVTHVDLEGDQCLVFFLQGIPLNATASGNPSAPAFGGQGFSTNPKNPTMPGGSRVGPFYTFTATRFMPRPNSNSSNDINPFSNGISSPLPLQPAGTFLAYMDYYSNPPPPAGDPTTTWLKKPNPPSIGSRGYTPYVYFSNNGRKNGYIQYPLQLPSNDLYNNGRYVTTYVQPAPNTSQFLAPDTWQIISAGADGYFNSAPTGSQPTCFQWSTKNVSNLYETRVNNRPVGGQDDITNFYGNKLGIPQ